MHRLKMDWPSTLKAWDVRESEAIDHQGRYAPRDSCAHPILVIELALELGLDYLLPSAFYDLSRYGPSKIFVGAAPSPGTVHYTQQSKSADPSPVRLSNEDLLRTLVGRETAQTYIANFIDRELSDRPIARDCANKNQPNAQLCAESFFYIRLNILRSVGGVACGRDGDPLYTLIQAIEMLSRTDFTDGVRQRGLKMCHACKSDFARVAVKAREEAWMLIPEWFGLRI